MAASSSRQNFMLDRLGTLIPINSFRAHDRPVVVNRDRTKKSDSSQPNERRDLEIADVSTPIHGSKYNNERIGCLKV